MDGLKAWPFKTSHHPGHAHSCTASKAVCVKRGELLKRVTVAWCDVRERAVPGAQVTMLKRRLQAREVIFSQINHNPTSDSTSNNFGSQARHVIKSGV